MKKLLASALVLTAFAAVASAKETGNLWHVSADGVSGTFNPQPGPGRDGPICDITFGSNIDSWDLLSDPDNLVFDINLARDCFGLPDGTAISMNGIGWDVTLNAFSPSWLSELSVYFDDTIAPDGFGLFLRPGVADSFPGTGTYSSGGIIKLDDVGIPNVDLPNGHLRLEFHETFDDFANGVDGNWKEGSILHVQIVPEPATLSLLALGGLALIRRR